MAEGVRVLLREHGITVMRGKRRFAGAGRIIVVGADGADQTSPRITS